MCCSWQHVRDQSVRRFPTTAHNTAPPKRSTNVSLAENLPAEATDLGIKVSQAAEVGLARAVTDKRAEVWMEQNADAIASSNEYVEKRGLPLPQFRNFW
ncbi:type II toxin-antitoxin system CcdA family antitoxin [Paraburkholderia flagellata]|uniref:type II toxin-antitoxin system CcdA family antitoxin n=1 Tax=Paraburkholderia flagellata TaxID=2883241 RepID=UPI001F41E2CE|nr:type II toxin-antitoxin system CcdA family antitoxin [Paraburkholderia flagellata]